MLFRSVCQILQSSAQTNSNLKISLKDELAIISVNLSPLPLCPHQKYIMTQIGRQPQLFSQMEDDLNFVGKWKMASIFGEMEYIVDFKEVPSSFWQSKIVQKTIYICTKHLIIFLMLFEFVNLWIFSLGQTLYALLYVRCMLFGVCCPVYVPRFKNSQRNLYMT